MANHGAELDGIYQALSDGTRRGVVEALVLGPATVTDLAPRGLSLPTFLKHLKVLEAAGLVRTEKQGRTRTCHLEPEGLRTAENWFARRRAEMERKLDRLARLAEELEKESKQ